MTEFNVWFDSPEAHGLRKAIKSADLFDSSGRFLSVDTEIIDLVKMAFEEGQDQRIAKFESEKAELKAEVASLQCKCINAASAILHVMEDLEEIQKTGKK